MFTHQNSSTFRVQMTLTMATSTCSPAANCSIKFSEDDVLKDKVVEMLKNQHQKHGSKDGKVKQLAATLEHKDIILQACPNVLHDALDEALPCHDSVLKNAQLFDADKSC